MDLAFYNAGCEASKGKRALLIAPRRLIRRMLRPMAYRLEDILKHFLLRMDHADRNMGTLHADFLALRTEVMNLRAHNAILSERVNELTNHTVVLADQARTAIAMAWDEVAVVRRLAVIEEHIETLLPASTHTPAQDEMIPAIMFPGLDRTKTQAS